MEDRKPVILTRPEHNISRSNIDRDALSVLHRLNQHDYIAYLVGGSVRDLLLGRKPKDFDVGTNAHPKEIRRLFHNCFLIGRRFRLAHIKFGPTKNIETCTFRREPEGGDEGMLQHRDNTFGTPVEDAHRRDFTINGLFYDIRTFNVIDHVGGLTDLKARLIRTIGDPDNRFREDPVRMVRAVRFAARLGFKIESGTYESILRHHREIEKASKARLLEEVYRLFPYRSGEAAFRLLWKTKLLSVMFPELDQYLEETDGQSSPLWKYLMTLDAMCDRSGAAPSPSLIFGTLFLPVFLLHVERMESHGKQPSYLDLANNTLHPISLHFQMPKSVFYQVVHMFNMVRRLELENIQQGNAQHQRGIPGWQRKLMEHEAFRDALALFEVHVGATGANPDRLHYWLKLSESHGAAHPGHHEDKGPRSGRFSRRRRRPHPHHRRDVPPQ